MAAANTYDTLRALDLATINAAAVADQLKAIQQVSPEVTADDVAAQFRIVAKVAKQTDRETFETWARGGEMPIVALTPRGARGGSRWLLVEHSRHDEVVGDRDRCRLRVVVSGTKPRITADA